MTRGLVLAMVLVLCGAQIAAAEMYVGIYGGPSAAPDTDIVGNRSSSGIELQGVGFDAGGAVGAKVGGWSRRLPFVAFEGNIWGTFASARSLAGVVVNNHFVGRADVDADINLLNFSGSVLLQRPLGRLRPYAGVGLLVSYAETSHVSLGGFSNASDSTVSPGLILQAGLEYRVNRALGLFSEYRYTYASYDFGSWEASVDLPTHNFLFGAAMHF